MVWPKRHGIQPNLVRIWTAKAEAGEFDVISPPPDPTGVRGAHRRAGSVWYGKLGPRWEKRVPKRGLRRKARKPTSGEDPSLAGPVVSRRSQKDAG